MNLIKRFFGQDKEELPEGIKRYIEKKREINLKGEIKDTDFVVFDTELTGLDYRKDSIIAIGAVKMKGTRLFPAKNFYRLVKPSSTLKVEGVLAHELTPSDLKEGIEPEEAVREFIGFVDSAVLVGHFVNIDIHFVNAALKRHFSIKLHNPVVDTLNINNWLYENASSFRRHFRGATEKTDLYTLAKRYGITVHTTHNALYDAYLTAQLFQRFLFFLQDAGVKTVKELLMVGRG
ncbi:MAG: 3'-5' exonuclease [Nitrospirae bacterium]|nr:MAG: 3'-5' exonuclease [Nitrospirota bacterium]